MRLYSYEYLARDMTIVFNHNPEFVYNFADSDPVYGGPERIYEYPSLGLVFNSYPGKFHVFADKQVFHSENNEQYLSLYWK